MWIIILVGLCTISQGMKAFSQIKVNGKIDKNKDGKKEVKPKLMGKRKNTINKKHMTIHDYIDSHFISL